MALLVITARNRTGSGRWPAQLWRDSGYVFATPVGEPINPNTDYHHWKRLLADAGLRDGRLHDARHTAATVLLILGVPERAVMGIMGWSTTAMAARYQHVTGVVRGDVAKRVGGLIWGAAERQVRLELRLDDNAGLTLAGRPGVCAGQAAEDAGFEPARA